MSLTIQLPPELEVRLRREAERHGMEPGEYAARLLRDRLPATEPKPSLWNTLPPEEWARQFREWAESHRELPVLPPEAMERESFYGERG